MTSTTTDFWRAIREIFRRGAENQHFLLTPFLLRRENRAQIPRTENRTGLPSLMSAPGHPTANLRCKVRNASASLPYPDTAFCSSKQALRSSISTTTVSLQAQRGSQATTMNGLRNPSLRILLIPAASACVPVIPLRRRNASSGPQPAPPDINALFGSLAAMF
jgi:hypothetical protein